MPKELPLNVDGVNPFGDLIGLKFIEVKDGFSLCTLTIDRKLLNPHGVLHGGVIYSLADTNMGAALYTAMEDDELCASIEVKINYFSSVSSGRIICKSKLVHKQGKIAFLESEVYSEDGRLIAKATGTFYVFKAKKS